MHDGVSWGACLDLRLNRAPLHAFVQNVDITFDPPAWSAGGRSALPQGVVTTTSLERALLGKPAYLSPAGAPARTVRLSAGIRSQESDMYVAVDESQARALDAMHVMGDAGRSAAQRSAVLCRGTVLLQAQESATLSLTQRGGLVGRGQAALHAWLSTPCGLYHYCLCRPHSTAV